MRLEQAILVGFLLLASSGLNGDDDRRRVFRDTPRFKDYPAGEIFKGKPAAPRFDEADYKDPYVTHYSEGAQYDAARGQILLAITQSRGGAVERVAAGWSLSTQRMDGCRVRAGR